MSRREAAALLGFASEFKVRQLERAGTLRATRGIMGSAWYARADVLAVRAAQATASPATPPAWSGAAAANIRRSDAELIAYLRGPATPGAPLRTVADLVADTGVSIVRAQKVFRFWLAHDAHPVAAPVRAAQGRRTSVMQTDPEGPPPRSERRSPARVARASLIRDLRAADPTVRKAAFEELKRRRPSADAS